MGRESSRSGPTGEARSSNRPPLRYGDIHTSTKIAQKGIDGSKHELHSARVSKNQPGKPRRTIVHTVAASPVLTSPDMRFRSQSQHKGVDPISVAAAEDRTSKKRKRALSGQSIIGETAAPSGLPRAAPKTIELHKMSVDPASSQLPKKIIPKEQESSNASSKKRNKKNLEPAQVTGHDTTDLPGLPTGAPLQSGGYGASNPSGQPLSKTQKRRLKRMNQAARLREAEGRRIDPLAPDDDASTTAPTKNINDSSSKTNASLEKAKDKKRKHQDSMEPGRTQASANDVIVMNEIVAPPSHTSPKMVKKKKRKTRELIDPNASTTSDTQALSAQVSADIADQGDPTATRSTSLGNTRQDTGTAGTALTKSYSKIPVPPLAHWQSTSNADIAAEKSTEATEHRQRRSSKKKYVTPSVPIRRPNGSRPIAEQLQSANGSFRLIRAKNMTLKRGFPERGELTEDEMQVIDNLVNEFMDLNDFTLDQIYEIIDLPARSIRARGFWSMIKEALSDRKTDIAKAMRPRAARGERGQLDDAEVDALREMIANDPHGNWVDRAKALNRHPTVVRNFYINYMKHQTHNTTLDRGAKKWNEIETQQLKVAGEKQIAMLKRAECGIALDDPTPIEITDADYLDPAYQIDSFALAGKIGNRGPLAIRKKWRKLRWHKEREVQMVAAEIKYGSFERHFEMQAVSNYQLMLPGDKVGCLKGLLVIARENAIRPVDYGSNKMQTMKCYIPGEWSIRDAYEVLFQTRKIVERKENKLVDYLVKAVGYFNKTYSPAQLDQVFTGPIEIWIDMYNRRRRDRWVYERGASAAVDPPPGLTVADAEAFVEKNGQIPRPERWDLRGWSLWEGMGYSALSDPFIYGDSDEEDEDDDDIEEGVTKVKSKGKKVVLRPAPESDQDDPVEDSDDD